MTNLHESYLAGHGFDITTPRLNTDDRSPALPTLLPDPVNMRVYMCARSNVCVSEHACVYASDGWTDEQRMERWVDLNDFMCVCACARHCLRVTLCARLES